MKKTETEPGPRPESERRSYRNARIAFVHGRPGPHPSHAALAKSVDADFYFVDEFIRYHDLPHASRRRRYLSWFVNSVFMKNAHRYDLFIFEGIHFPPIIRKRLGLLKKGQRVAAMMGDETIYFLKIKWYPESSRWAVLTALSRYDALICLSKMQADIARTLVNDGPAPKIIVGHEAIGEARFHSLGKVSPQLDGEKILFVGHGPSGWRGFYKGIETLMATFELVAEKRPGSRLTIVGEWETSYISELLSKLSHGRDRVRFVGPQNDLGEFFQDADLYVHLANGDAFPVSTLESLRAGLPIIVSEWTGTKEVVAQIDERMVVEAEAIQASERISWYFDLPVAEKRRISDRGRQVVSQFSAEKSCAEFQAAVDEILNTK